MSAPMATIYSSLLNMIIRADPAAMNSRLMATSIGNLLNLSWRYTEVARVDTMKIIMESAMSEAENRESTSCSTM